MSRDTIPAVISNCSGFVAVVTHRMAILVRGLTIFDDARQGESTHIKRKARLYSTFGIPRMGDKAAHTSNGLMELTGSTPWDSQSFPAPLERTLPMPSVPSEHIREVLS